MEDLCVASVSIDSEVNDVDENLRRIAHWTGRAAAEGAKVVVFPELSVNGMLEHRAIRESADTVPGRASEELRAVARRHDVTICCGILEKDADAFYDSQILVNASGLLGKQRKLHVPEGEAALWSAGSVAEVFDLGGVRVGIMICLDALYGELARTLFLRGAEVLIMPCAMVTRAVDDRRCFPEASIIACCHRAACFTNGCYGIVSNVAGTRPESEWEPEGRCYLGWAGVYGPFGDVRAWTREPGNDDAMAVGNLDADALGERRSNPYFVPRYLRGDIYDTPKGPS